MRYLVLAVLFSLCISQHAEAFESVAPLISCSGSSEIAAPQPEPGDHLLEHSRNLVAKMRQDKFDIRITMLGHKAIRSLCIHCLNTTSNSKNGIYPRKFNFHEGSLASAESIYTRRGGYDPATAGGEYQNRKIR